jgi:hypothetical protein
MGLEDIYQRNVKKVSINQSGISSGIPSTRERDPNQVKLEQDVFSKMQEVSRPPETKKEESKPVQQIASVGLEQALKELINGVESLDDKS